MIKKINYVLDRRQKINLCILLVIIFIGAFVELLGVSAIMPLINVAMNPETIDEKWYFVLIRKYTGITDANQMILFLAVLLIVIYILKNVYVMVMYSLQYRFVFNNQQRLSVRMMKSYMQQDYLFHVSKNVAEFQRNITSDVNGFFTIVLNVLQFLAEFSVSAILVIFLFIQDWVSTVAVAVLLFLFMGNIGRKVAKAAESLGCKIIFYSASGNSTCTEYDRVDLDTLLAQSDVLSLHCPLSDRTRNLIDLAAMKKMKKSAVLINVARGPVVNSADLYTALTEGEIAAAGLDVLEKEPITDENPLSRFKDSNRLIITPHMAWAGVEARERCVDGVYRNIKNFLAGTPCNVVNG